MTVNEYFIEEGMKKWEKYAYDKDVNRVEELYLDEKGKITSNEKNIYMDGLRVEKQYYNPRGRLVKKMLYVYEYSK